MELVSGSSRVVGDNGWIASGTCRTDGSGQGQLKWPNSGNLSRRLGSKVGLTVFAKRGNFHFRSDFVPPPLKVARLQKKLALDKGFCN